MLPLRRLLASPQIRLQRSRRRAVEEHHPYEQLRATENNIVLPGATEDALKALPEFKYASS
jgi:hypothetical protein